MFPVTVNNDTIAGSYGDNVATVSKANTNTIGTISSTDSSPFISLTQVGSRNCTEMLIKECHGSLRVWTKMNEASDFVYYAPSNDVLSRFANSVLKQQVSQLSGSETSAMTVDSIALCLPLDGNLKVLALFDRVQKGGIVQFGDCEFLVDSLANFGDAKLAPFSDLVKKPSSGDVDFCTYLIFTQQNHATPLSICVSRSSSDTFSVVLRKGDVCSSRADHEVKTVGDLARFCVGNSVREFFYSTNFPLASNEYSASWLIGQLKAEVILRITGNQGDHFDFQVQTIFPVDKTDDGYFLQKAGYDHIWRSWITLNNKPNMW